MMNGISPALAALEERFNGIPLPDWRYEMRRQAQEILPNLFLGPFQPSNQLSILQSLKITHILCIAESREAHLFRACFPGQFTYLIKEIRDADDQNLIRIFPQTQAFIDQALDAGGRVYVHCGDGISRSPAVLTAYVMSKTGLTHSDAFTFVQTRRFCIAPRVEFQHQLENYEAIISATSTIATDTLARLGTNDRRRGRVDESDDEMDSDDKIVSAVDGDMIQRVPNWH